MACGARYDEVEQYPAALLVERERGRKRNDIRDNGLAHKLGVAARQRYQRD